MLKQLLQCDGGVDSVFIIRPESHTCKTEISMKTEVKRNSNFHAHNRLHNLYETHTYYETKHHTQNKKNNHNYDEPDKTSNKVMGNTNRTTIPLP